MTYSKELQLLRDTYKKTNLKLACFKQADFFELKATHPFNDLHSDNASSFPALFSGPLLPLTMYRQTDIYRREWIYLLLPKKPEQEVLLIGPFVSKALSKEEVWEIGEQTGIPPQMQKTLIEYYATLPLLRNTSSLLVMLEAFCERVWNTSSFAVVDVNAKTPLTAHINPQRPHPEGLDYHLAKMKILERRYEIENELIKAVVKGQTQKVKWFPSDFNSLHLENRSTTPLRDAKNYCIIMNTLLRKAAENTGVHPVYIDETSSDLAKRIEAISTIQQCTPLMAQIFLSYCRLVRNNTTSKYSPIVQKAVLLIDNDLSSHLTLSTIAKAQDLSQGYLATLFKRETGKSVCEFVRERRMAHAEDLLSSTRLQIQTIAQHCGIMDLQYFSKLFKKQTGKTPNEYRKALQKS